VIYTGALAFIFREPGSSLPRRSRRRWTIEASARPDVKADAKQTTKKPSAYKSALRLVISKRLTNDQEEKVTIESRAVEERMRWEALNLGKEAQDDGQENEQDSQTNGWCGALDLKASI
jgi:hypothetical protein